jgi:hypothetical protein
MRTADGRFFRLRGWRVFHAVDRNEAPFRLNLTAAFYTLMTSGPRNAFLKKEEKP